MYRYPAFRRGFTAFAEQLYFVLKAGIRRDGIVADSVPIIGKPACSSLPDAGMVNTSARSNI